MTKCIPRLETEVSFPKDKSEWHSCLDGFVNDALTIKEYVNNLPETRATFRLKEVDLRHRESTLPTEIVKFTGAWPEPDILRENDTRGFVNPNYVHAQHYSDAIVRCGCGIPVLRQQFGKDEPQPNHHQDHNENCTKIDRTKARLELLQNRRDIIRDGYQYGHSVASISPRLGYPETYHIGGGECEKLGLNIEQLGRESRKKMARTAMVLCREYSTETVAEIYGVHRRSISAMIREETKSNPKALYSVRRASD